MALLCEYFSMVIFWRQSRKLMFASGVRHKTLTTCISVFVVFFPRQMMPRI